MGDVGIRLAVENRTGFQRDTGAAASSVAKIGDAAQRVQEQTSRLTAVSAKLSTVGRSWTKFVTLPILGAGAALFKVGQVQDDALDSIRIGTGKAGRALRGLEKDYSAVLRSVPVTSDLAATAVTDLNKRLDLTGIRLRRRSRQFLELSRITETDLGQNIQTVTRLFGDWDIATRKQGRSLDYLFRVGQKTGGTVAGLGQLLVKYGAPLRQMGFDFETSAALMGKFEKEGVNTGLVLGSLRIALGKMATEGVKDPVKGLDSLITRIEAAGSTGKANALAIEAFGARAGPDMAAAIREGRFEIKNLLKDLDRGGDTIMKAGRQTRDGAEMWQLFKNRLMDAAAPLAEDLFNALKKAGPALKSVIDKVRDGVKWFTNLSPEGQKTILMIGGLVAAIGPALVVLSRLVLGFKSVISIVRGLGVALRFLVMNPWALLITAAITLVVLIVKNWDKVKKVTAAVWNWIVDKVKWAWDHIIKYTPIGFLVDLIVRNFDKIKRVAKAVWEWMVEKVEWVIDKVKALIDWINKAIDKLAGLLSDVTGKFADLNPLGTDRAAGTIGQWIQEQTGAGGGHRGNNTGGGVAGPRVMVPKAIPVPAGVPVGPRQPLIVQTFLDRREIGRAVIDDIRSRIADH